MDILRTCLYVVCVAVNYLISFLYLAMFLRAVFSLFPGSEDNIVGRFLYTVTEPFILPVRALLNKLNIGQDMPMDLSFMVTWLILLIISCLLPAISL